MSSGFKCGVCGLNKSYFVVHRASNKQTIVGELLNMQLYFFLSLLLKIRRNGGSLDSFALMTYSFARTVGYQF